MTGRTPGRWEVAAVIAVFVLTRTLAAAAGVHFDLAPLGFYWQYVDPVLLRDELWPSVLHLHSQPPLYNLFLGALVRLPAAWQAPAAHLVYLALGLGLILALLALLARLGVGLRLRLGLALLTVASPALVLYENHLSPTLPIAAALTAGALALHRFLSRGKTADGLAFSGLMAGVALTHSLFHLIWLAAALALAAAAPGPSRRRLAVLAGPALLALAWAVRSLVLYGTLATSSWLGMSLAHTAPRLLAPEERPVLLQGERAILEIPPFSPLPAYTGRAPLPLATGLAVLDQPWKSTGAPNLHHLAYIEISHRYLTAWRSLVSARPGLQARAVGAAWLLSFRSAADSPWLGENRDRIVRWVQLARLLGGQRARFEGALGAGRVSWLLALAWVLGVAWGIREVVRALRDRGRDPEALTIAFLVLCLLWVALVGNTVELGENDRFRWLAQPLATVLFGLAARRSGGRIEPSDPLP